MSAEINWNRLVNTLYGSLATKLCLRPVRVAPHVVRLQDHLYAHCGDTSAKTGYRLSTLLWTKGDFEAKFFFDCRLMPEGCEPLTEDELPGLELYPKPICSWMFKDVKSGGIAYTSNKNGFRCKSLGMGPIQVHYLKSRRVAKELLFAIEIVMRRRGEKRR
jgi:hypothetical protein